MVHQKVEITPKTAREALGLKNRSILCDIIKILKFKLQDLLSYSFNFSQIHFFFVKTICNLICTLDYISSHLNTAFKQPQYVIVVQGATEKIQIFILMVRVSNSRKTASDINDFPRSLCEAEQIAELEYYPNQSGSLYHFCRFLLLWRVPKCNKRPQ